MKGFFQIAVGVAVLLCGLFLMRFGLQRVFSDSFRRMLISFTSTPWRGLIVGTIAAALMQSSTALTLITVGLVSAGYLSFYRSLGIILGANIGTCTTVQLLSLTIPDDLLAFLFTLCVLIAVLSRRWRYHAMAVAGMVGMFGGVHVLSFSIGTLTALETVVSFLSATGEKPLFGIIGGIMLTFMCQSSSAATGLLMVLAEEGLIDLKVAVYGVYGNNIGSCLSSVVVGATAPLAAKRVAMAHIVLNTVGVMAFFPFSGCLVKIATWFTGDFGVQVAMVHTLFNVISSLAVLPVARGFSRLITFMVPGKGD